MSLNPGPNPSRWTWHDRQEYQDANCEGPADYAPDTDTYAGTCDNCDKPFYVEPHETRWETSSAGDATFCCACVGCSGDHD